MPSNQDKARANELAILTAIGEVGWLSTSQVARWVWPASTLHVATNKAAAALRRLTNQGYLLCRQNALGVRVFVLTTSGALRANGDGWPAYRAGYKLSQLNCYRQQLIVEFILQMLAKGHVCAGPAGLREAIATRAIIEDDFRGADALIQDNEMNVTTPVLVVHSLSHSVVKKAVCLKKVSGVIHLLGHPVLIRQFEKEMAKLEKIISAAPVAKH